jgi:hypothetical protein
MHINRATRGNFGLTDGNIGINSLRLQVIRKNPTGLSSCPPHQHGAACCGAATRNGEEDLSRHTTVYRCRLKSREEAGSGITETDRAFPLAVPTDPEPHMMVRPPVAAGNSPSRHNTVYRCRIEGREEAGLNVETSLREKMMIGR